MSGSVWMFSDQIDDEEMLNTNRSILFLSATRAIDFA